MLRAREITIATYNHRPGYTGSVGVQHQNTQSHKRRYRSLEVQQKTRIDTIEIYRVRLRSARKNTFTQKDKQATWEFTVEPHIHKKAIEGT